MTIMFKRSFSSRNKGDEFVVVDRTVDVTMSDKMSSSSSAIQCDSNLSLDLHPLGHDQGLLVTVRPPKQPENDINHVPCDIVLVIDVSGSMGVAADLPDQAGQAEKETSGLSILDLTKHAARTVLENLNQNDRLGVVTFSTEAKVVSKLVPMTDENKSKVWGKIDKLQDLQSTNLWDGIRTGLKVFDDAELVGNVQGLYVLTDGMPNVMCPAQGYVAKLRPMLEKTASKRGCVPSIHTFGFGYDIISTLMQSIAEVGHGNYAFIPDAGMIGTVFVHAVANLFNTFATSAVLELEVSSTSSRSKASIAAAECYTSGAEGTTSSAHKLVLQLGNLQCGQTRDILVHPQKLLPEDIISAKLRYAVPSKFGRNDVIISRTTPGQFTTLSHSVIDYHLYRTQLCNLLSSLFPLLPNGQHSIVDDNEVDGVRARLVDLAKLICESQTYATNDDLEALYTDLVGEDPAGQTTKALILIAPADGIKTEDEGRFAYHHRHLNEYWRRWGRHYLPSLLHAHMRQVCNSFKDSGPLRYGLDAPLFIKCRGELDAAFDSLPPPKPTLPPPMIYDSSGRQRVGKHVSMKMSRYNSRSNPCFDGNCSVLFADGEERKVEHLRPGSVVWTPAGGRKVAAVVKTALSGSKQPLCRVSNLWVTPWHPIRVEGKWVFPAHVAEEIIFSNNPVYSVLLERSSDSEAHAINIGGQVCVTLGHGKTEPDDVHDARVHSFFGNYDEVARSLGDLSEDSGGRLICGGISRETITGLICGFIRPNKPVKLLEETRINGGLSDVNAASMIVTAI